MRGIWGWLGTNTGLRVGLVLAALVTLMGGWALGEEAVASSAAPPFAAAGTVQPFLAALAVVVVSAGLLLRAVAAEEGRAARRPR